MSLITKLMKGFNLSPSNIVKMEIISTVKPDIPKKPEVKIEYNNRSYESFVKNGFPDNIPRPIKGPMIGCKSSLSKVDLRKGPIERTVTYDCQTKGTRLEFTKA